MRHINEIIQELTSHPDYIYSSDIITKDDIFTEFVNQLADIDNYFSISELSEDLLFDYWYNKWKDIKSIKPYIEFGESYPYFSYNFEHWFNNELSEEIRNEFLMDEDQIKEFFSDVNLVSQKISEKQEKIRSLIL